MSRARLISGVLLFVPATTLAQGNPVGPEFRVNTYTTLAQTRPSVAADASGNFVVVWGSASQDGSGFGIFGQQFSSAGLPLGPELRVNSYVTGEQRYPSVASDAAGNFVVVWQSDYRAVLGQRFSTSGTPLGAEFAVHAGSHALMGPNIAADSSGNFVVVWTESGLGFPPVVFGQRYDSSGNALGTAFRVNAVTNAGHDAAAVAMDPVGNFVVVWTRSDPPFIRPIFGRRFASTGVPFGPEFQVSTSLPGYLGGADVAVDASGSFVVVWGAADAFAGLLGDLYGQRFAGNGVPVGPEFPIAPTPDAEIGPSVRSDPAGNFVVVWSGDHGSSSFEVFGQRYTSDGAPLGTEFRVNTYTTNAQSQGVVAVDPLGFVVVWQSSGQDGSDSGGFGQRYLPIVPVELMQFGVE
jgi:large repetitive protein